MAYILARQGKDAKVNGRDVGSQRFRNSSAMNESILDRLRVSAITAMGKEEAYHWTCPEYPRIPRLRPFLSVGICAALLRKKPEEDEEEDDDDEDGYSE